MKNIKLLIGFAAMLLISSCQEDELITYQGNNNIYFSDAVFQYALNSDYIDSKAISFAMDASTITQKTVDILVRTQGNVVDYDRTYNVEVVTANTTAVENTNFQPIASTQTFRAGKIVDTLKVVLNRTEELKDTTLEIQIKLLPNNEFNTDMQEIEQGNYTVSCVTYTLTFNDIFEKPIGWNAIMDRYYWGPYSRKKWDIICQLMGWPLNKLDPETSPGIPSFGLVMTAGGKLKGYLQEMEDAGTPVLEEDGTPMVSGPYV